MEQADEIRIKPVGGRLEAEGSGPAGKTPHPEFHLGKPVEKLGTAEFFRQLTIRALLLQLTRLWAEVGFLELESIRQGGR